MTSGVPPAQQRLSRPSGIPPDLGPMAACPPNSLPRSTNSPAGEDSRGRLTPFRFLDLRWFKTGKVGALRSAVAWAAQRWWYGCRDAPLRREDHGRGEYDSFRLASAPAARGRGACSCAEPAASKAHLVSPRLSDRREPAAPHSEHRTAPLFARRRHIIILERQRVEAAVAL